MPRGGPGGCAEGRPAVRNLSMAVFADLDLRAGSDLKALRGLVENAAHRESPWFLGPRCLPSCDAPQTVGPRWGGTRRGRASFGPGLWDAAEAQAHRGVAWVPNAGDSKAVGSCYPF